MAPKPTYDPPPKQLAFLAVRARRRGMTFEAFWKEAVRPNQTLVMTTHPDPPPGALEWPTDQFDRETWKTAIEATKDSWRRAYEQTPATPQEAALGILAPALERMARRAAAAAASAPPAGMPVQPGVASAA